MNRYFAKTTLVLFLLMQGYIKVLAQDPGQKLIQWSDTAPIEKVHLHFDRDNYIAGETAWFKAYLSSDFYPDTISTTLYVELSSEQGVIQRMIVPVFEGTGRGYLQLPDTLSTGIHTIQAYTATMLNQQPDFVFRKRIKVFGRQNSLAVAQPAPSLNVQFFPEGGNLAWEQESIVAFKATDEKGKPINISGDVISTSDEKQKITVVTYHDGMGSFLFTPRKGVRSHLKVTGERGGEFYLPEPQDNAVLLAISSTPQAVSFTIRKTGQRSLVPGYILGQMQHHVVFRQELQQGAQHINGWINTLNLNSGILQITVFSTEGIPLTERLVFINNGEFNITGELKADTLNFQPKKLNQLSLNLRDTVIGSFSVSIIDESLDEPENERGDIITNFLLTSDIRGTVHNPNWYFEANADSVRMGLDLLMLTNGWRRFEWKELVKNSHPQKKYTDLSYISIAGRANLSGSRRPFANSSLMVIINNPDSTSTVQLTETDDKGDFKLDSMFFWGKNRLLFSDPSGKKSKLIEIRMSHDSLARGFSLYKSPPEYFFLTAEAGKKYKPDYDLIQKENGLLLDEVTLTSRRKKTPTQVTNEKYTTGIFSGPSDHVIDLVNTEEKLVQRNIFEYLQGRVPGITVTSGGAFGNDYTLFYRGGRTMSFRGPVPMLLYLNEMPIDAAYLSGIRPDDIALVKVYSSFAGAPGNGAGGVLSIYTKTMDDRGKTTPGAGYEIVYNGYSLYREFYSPNYDLDKEARSIQDHRITLHWQPDIYVSDIDASIPIRFYNNDRTKAFKVRVEGMTRNGKYLVLEKHFRL